MAVQFAALLLLLSDQHHQVLLYLYLFAQLLAQDLYLSLLPFDLPLEVGHRFVELNLLQLYGFAGR